MLTNVAASLALRATATTRARPISTAGAYAASTSTWPATPTAPPARPLREHHREVQEERRQRENRDRVGPVEHPVEAIETAAEGEGEHAEEGDREPEEMQRRRIARAPQPNRAAHEQREDADRGEHEVAARPDRLARREPDIDHFTRAESKRRIAERAIAA